MQRKTLPSRSTNREVYSYPPRHFKDPYFSKKTSLMQTHLHRTSSAKLTEIMWTGSRLLKTVYVKAREASNARGQWNKRSYDLRVQVHDKQPGDKGLLWNLRPPEKHKLDNQWSSQKYIICKQLPGLPINQSALIGGSPKTWHWKHLLPLSEAVKVPTRTETPSPRPGKLPLPGKSSH